MKREFEIFMKRPDGSMYNSVFVTDDSDTLGIIGKVLSLISEMDPGDEVAVICYGEE